MSPMIFAYVTVFTLMLAGAAAALEWGMLGRSATRQLWTIAIVLALVAPPLVMAWHTFEPPGSSVQRSAPKDPFASAVLGSSAALMREAGTVVSRDAAIRTVLPTRHAARAGLLHLNTSIARVALDVWAILSLLMIAWLALGMARWRRVKRVWRRTTLDGVDVDISARTGPAVLGILSHRIVLPKWATTLSPGHRRLVLAHECEHISAHDPQRLALAIAALVVMPWNLALWWCAARLRRAIEFDCDARVLCRFPDAREYGHVLLEVASRGRDTGTLCVPMVALLRLPSELELRIRTMLRPRPQNVRMLTLSGAIALVAVCAAFAAPVPALRRARSFTARAGTWRPDTIPKRRDSTSWNGKRDVDSVHLLLRRVQESQLQLARSRVQLAAATAALHSAEHSMKLSDSVKAAIEAARPRMYGMATLHTADVAAALERSRAALMSSSAASQRAHAEMERIHVQILHALNARYPNIVAHPDSGAMIWFVADSTGRVLQTIYNDAFLHPQLATDSIYARFPEINPAAVGSITEESQLLGRANLSVTWVRLKGEPSQYFKSHR